MDIDPGIPIHEQGPAWHVETICPRQLEIDHEQPSAWTHTPVHLLPTGISSDIAYTTVGHVADDPPAQSGTDVDESARLQQGSVQKRRQNTGQARYRNEVWESMRPVLDDLRSAEYRSTVDQNILVLRLVHNFIVTRKDEYHNRVRKSEGRSSQRFEKIPHDGFPYYLNEHIKNPTPAMVVPLPAQAKIRLCIAVDTYVRKYKFPDAKGPSTSLEYPASDQELELEWCAWESVCRGVYQMMLKKNNFTEEKKKKSSSRKKPKFRSADGKERDGNKMRQTANTLLQHELFTPIEKTAQSYCPQVLGSFWIICLRLFKIGAIIGRCIGDPDMYHSQFIRQLTEAIRASLREQIERLRPLQQKKKKQKTDKEVGFCDVLDALDAVGASDVQDALRLGHLCTARAMSLRLPHNNPLVLKLWSTYHLSWDVQAIQRGLSLQAYQSELKTIYDGQINADSEMKTMYYHARGLFRVSHDFQQAYTVASQLWKSASSCVASSSQQPSWNFRTCAMAEAAIMMGQLSHVTHDNKIISGKEREKIRKDLRLRSKKHRARWRGTLSPSMDIERAVAAMSAINQCIKLLENSSTKQISGRRQLRSEQVLQNLTSIAL
ncbi:hypothetical protein MGU_10070 [Metarhizium guizhouense ARSEF 977]|uniref:Uncharacterized protein n=1 Tax=Metarhizium guizhouense (strain ARSEF 977) TaxID=1276136 RepID=A0A0B4GJH4_METGA|nr:hypothetical protein MGU_10070 [Metarhizium guizhouense ARSEF 977]